MVVSRRALHERPGACLQLGCGAEGEEAAATGCVSVSGELPVGWLAIRCVVDGTVWAVDCCRWPLQMGYPSCRREREAWHDAEHRTTVILISGRFRLDLAADSQVLSMEGDYGIWGPGIGHSRHAEDDSAVLTIRWRSLSQKPADVR